MINGCKPTLKCQKDNELAGLKGNQLFNIIFTPISQNSSHITAQKALKRLLSTLLLLAVIIPHARAQLCTGSLGDPVVNIDFGAGSNPGPPLKAATTAYQYVSSSCPGDGYYTLTNSTFNCFDSWHTLTADHTGNPNGYFMLINASYQPSDFYLDTVRNLCGSTTYEFAAWILNMLTIHNPCPNGGIMPNITFSIETITGVSLGSFQTGNINISSDNTWKQYGLFFTTPPNVSAVVVRMTNNAPGGCGNDLALDDITFRPCGPRVNAGRTGSGDNTPINLCEDDPTVLDFAAGVSAGYNSPTYQWQLSRDGGAVWADISGAGSTSYKRTPTGPGVYLYRLAVSEGGNIGLSSCRVSSNALKVTVHEKPLLQARNDGPKCEGYTIRLSAGYGNLYTWTGPAAFAATGDTLSLTGTTTANAGKYYVRATSSAGCSRNDSTLVLINPNPVAKYGLPSPFCEKNILHFQDLSFVPGPGGSLVKWNWNFGDGSRSTLQSPNHVFSSANSYNVSLGVITDKGCRSPVQTSTIQVHNLPHPGFSLPQICLADPSAVFNDSSTIGDNSEAQFRYSWNFGDPNANAGNPNTSTAKDPAHTYTAAGPYQVSQTVTSKDGCVKDTVNTFMVNGSFPISAFTVKNNTGLCSNTAVALTDGSSVMPGNIIRVEIYWDYLNDPTVKTIDDHPSPGKKYSHSYAEFSSPATRDFKVQYIVYSGISCMKQYAQTITVKGSPKVQFDALLPVCEEVAAFPLKGGHETTGISGSGIYSGRGVEEGELFDPRVAAAGIDTIRYTFTAVNGCSSAAVQPIIIYPQPKANAGPNQYMLEGGSARLEGSGSGSNLRYTWTPDSAMNDVTITRPRVSPSQDITYTLTVVSDQGCRDSSAAQVIVLKVPIVPNAFSPNGDGINDTWVIRYLAPYPGAEVQVFNRYGQLVYHSVGYTTPWDGRYNGQPLPVATYYWIINPKNGRKQISGSVTILR
jgi:gliding motility-associated-like protein